MAKQPSSFLCVTCTLFEELYKGTFHGVVKLFRSPLPVLAPTVQEAV
jgi:hypothetical protein